VARPDGCVPFGQLMRGRKPGSNGQPSLFLSGRLFSRTQYHISRMVSLGKPTLLFMHFIILLINLFKSESYLRSNRFVWSKTRTYKTSEIKVKGLVMHNSNYFLGNTWIIVKRIQFRTRNFFESFKATGGTLGCLKTLLTNQV
jgi:hypothetical protein